MRAMILLIVLNFREKIYFRLTRAPNIARLVGEIQ